jgi:tetratricopeptide (TPR) repeat protein
VDLPTGLTPASAEDLFMAAQRQARDWGNHDLRPLYEKALAVDPGFSPARRELGKLATWQGLYDEAIEHFATARRRDEHSCELRYFHGVALLLAGRLAEARKALELAARGDVEARALVRLAELCLRESDWCHALKHLDRVAAMAPRLTRPRGLRAACLRRLGRREEAAVEIAAARAVDGQDPFLQVEAMLTAANGRLLAARGVKALLQQVRSHEPPLLEVAFDYLAAGLSDEAAVAVGLIPEPGPLALLVLAYVTEQLGRKAEALRTLRRACAADVVGHLPWRLEMIPILRWAAERLPDSPRPVFLLGDLLVARRRLDEGVALWERAQAMGETHYLLPSHLAFYHRSITKDNQAAGRQFRTAAAAEPSDLYLKRELVNVLTAEGKRPEVIAYLEGEMAAVLTSPLMAYSLLDAYLKEIQYDRFDALCGQVDFSPNWQIAGPHSLWNRRQFQEALQLGAEGQCERAMDILANLQPPPRHLGIPVGDTEDDRRYYHLGRLHEQMGDLERARACWEKSVAVRHYTGFETAYWNNHWTRRYYQALSLQKLGRATEAEAYFDAMELLSKVPELPLAARQELLKLVERGRFAPDDQKDPSGYVPIKVATAAEA